MKWMSVIAGIVLLLSVGCGKDASEEGRKRDSEPVSLESNLVGKWRMSGFRCNREGKCSYEKKSTKVRMTFTKDKQFIDSNSDIVMDYRIEGMTVSMKLSKETKRETDIEIKGGLAFDVVSMKKNEMLMQWNYQRGSSIYTKYQKVE